MRKKLCRDYLVRLVYPEDLIQYVGIVDLENSPRRTNYERYFADLGSRDEITQAVEDACFETDSLACRHCCPFDDWDEEDPTLCMTGFLNWLDKEATV